jgi:RNA polymerase-binding transcription factor
MTISQHLAKPRQDSFASASLTARSQVEDRKEEKMPDKNAGLSRAFVEQQRERLEMLRDQLLGTMEETEAEERDLQNRNVDEPGDLGDRSIPANQSEVDDARHAVSERRLRDVERALEKIEEGTYGLSDASDEPIPKKRLETAPEAIYTIEEESRREAAGSPTRS